MEQSGHFNYPVALVVIDEEGNERPGWALRAGDFIERTDYDHNRRVLAVQARARREPLPLRLRLRRWRESRRA